MVSFPLLTLFGVIFYDKSKKAITPSKIVSSKYSYHYTILLMLHIQVSKVLRNSFLNCRSEANKLLWQTEGQENNNMSTSTSSDIISLVQLQSTHFIIPHTINIFTHFTWPSSIPLSLALHYIRLRSPHLKWVFINQ